MKCTAAGRPFGGALLAYGIAALIGALVVGVAVPSGASTVVGRRVTRAEARMIRQSGQRTIDAGPRSYTLVLGVTTETEGTEPFTAEGVVDLASGATVATFEVTNVDGLEDATFEVRAQDRSLTYVRSGALTLPPGKEWVAVPTEQLPSTATSTSTLELIDGFVGTPRFVGRDEQHGVKTTHYVVDLELRAIVEAGGTLDRATERQLRRLEKRGQSLVPLNLWIDHDGRIRAMTLLVALTTELGGPSIDTRTEYFDYGVVLDATPPPADQVVPYDTVADQLAPYFGT